MAKITKRSGGRAGAGRVPLGSTASASRRRPRRQGLLPSTASAGASAASRSARTAPRGRPTPPARSRAPAPAGSYRRRSARDRSPLGATRRRCASWPTRFLSRARRAVNLSHDHRHLYRAHPGPDVAPALGRRRRRATSPAPTSRRSIHRLRATPRPQANHGRHPRCSKLFNLAERWGLRPDGLQPRPPRRALPCAGPPSLPERRRVPPPGRRAGCADAGPSSSRASRSRCACRRSRSRRIRLLMYTGARRERDPVAAVDRTSTSSARERWPAHQQDGLRRSSTCQRARAGPSCALRLPQRGGQPLRAAAGVRSAKHLVNITTPGTSSARSPGFKDVRLHDLRHSPPASPSPSAGLVAPVIGGLLGHSPAGDHRDATRTWRAITLKAASRAASARASRRR